MNDATFAVLVLAGPIGLLTITAPRVFDPSPPGLAGWVPHIAVGLLVVYGLARWLNRGDQRGDRHG